LHFVSRIYLKKEPDKISFYLTKLSV